MEAATDSLDALKLDCDYLPILILRVAAGAGASILN